MMYHEDGIPAAHSACYINCRHYHTEARLTEGLNDKGLRMTY